MNVKKYVVPNIPYAFIALFATKIGQAVRLAPGTDFSTKALHIMDDQTPFRFSWDWLVPSGLSVKDFIAPSSFEFAKGNTFGMGRKIGAVSYLQILAPEMNDRIIKEFLDMESSLILTMHIRSIDQMKAIKTIKRKITDLDKMKIEEQKKAVRSGYDMNQDQLSLYSVYMATLGNRPDLFPSSEYVTRYDTTTYPKYEIPPDALNDATFAAMSRTVKRCGKPRANGPKRRDLSRRQGAQVPSQNKGTRLRTRFSRACAEARFLRITIQERRSICQK